MNSGLSNRREIGYGGRFFTRHGPISPGSADPAGHPRRPAATRPPKFSNPFFILPRDFRYRLHRAFAVPAPANNLFNILRCGSSGLEIPLSQERIKAVAIPIFNAKWPGVRFFSIRLTRIQSPSGWIFTDNGLRDFRISEFLLIARRIVRCVIPSRATLLQERENHIPPS